MKIIKNKPRFITVLIVLLLFSSTQTFLFPLVQGVEQNFEQKTSLFLNDVVGLETEAYKTGQSEQQNNQRLGYVETEISSYFTSSEGSFRVTTSYVKDTLQMVYLSELQGECSLKEEKSNTVDMAKSFLKSYQYYASDSFYGKIASMLDNVKENTDLTKYGEDVKFEIKGSGENRVRYVWTYMDKNGVLVERKNVILIYDQGMFTGFFNNWALYTIADTPKISSEKATEIAIEASKTYSYLVTTENGSKISVSGFTIAPESLGYTKLVYLNSKEADSARGGDPFKLYPAWFVPLGFSKFYPGDVSGLTVILWADSGKVCSMNRVITDKGQMFSEDEQTDATDELILERNSQPPTMFVSVFVIVTILGTISLLNLTRVKLIGTKKLSSRSLGFVVCILLIGSIALPATPVVTAASVTGRSRIYACIDTNYGFLNETADYQEGLAIAGVCNYIENASSSAGYETYNLCGSRGTNVTAVLNQAYVDEQNCLNTMVFYAGHFSEFNNATQDNDGVPIHADDLFPQTSLGRHFFNFLWVCVQAENHTYGTPVAWTHRDNSTGHLFMSEHGFNESDGSGQCYISFYGFSPMLSNYYQNSTTSIFYEYNVNSTDIGPCKWFVTFFYYYALEQNHTVHAALDLASQDYFATSFDESVLYKGYNSWWPGGVNWTGEWSCMNTSGYFPMNYTEIFPDRGNNTMRVFGDSYIKLHQPLLSLSATGGLLPTFYVDGQPVSVGDVRVLSKIHTIDVSDVPGYTFSHFSSGYTNYGRPANIQIAFDRQITAHYVQQGQCSLTISAGTGGTTNPSPGTYWYNQSTPVQVTAIPSGAYSFSEWLLDGEHYSSNTTVTVTLDTSHNLQAEFTPPNKMLQIYVNGTGGTTNPSPGSYWYPQDSSVQVTAVPTGGFLQCWLLNGSYRVPTNPITIILNGTYILQPMFSEPPPYCPLSVPAYDYETSTPLNASIYLDEEYLGLTGNTFFVESGEHEIYVDDVGDDYIFWYYVYPGCEGDWRNPIDINVTSATTVTAYYQANETLEGPGIVDTTTDSGSIGWTHTRPSYYASGRYWVWYSDDTNLGFSTSLDGITWGPFTAVRPIYYSGSGTFDICFDDTYVHYVVKYKPKYGQETLYYRRGLPNPNGTITWSASEQVVFTSGDGGLYGSIYGPKITVDSQGYPWIGCYMPNCEYSGIYYHGAYAIKSSRNDGVWNTAAGFPYLVNTEYGIYAMLATPIALTSQKVFVIYSISTGEESYVCGRLWNGSSWLSVTRLNVKIEDSGKWSAVGESDIVHLAYVTENPVDIRYANYYASINAWWTFGTIESGVLSSVRPILSIDTNTTDLYCFWRVSNATAISIVYKKHSSGTWDANATEWITETEYGISSTAVTTFDHSYYNKIGVAYVVNLSSIAYPIKFNYLSLP